MMTTDAEYHDSAVILGGSSMFLDEMDTLESRVVVEMFHSYHYGGPGYLKPWLPAIKRQDGALSWSKWLDANGKETCAVDMTMFVAETICDLPN